MNVSSNLFLATILLNRILNDSSMLSSLILSNESKVCLLTISASFHATNDTSDGDFKTFVI